jgi:hypothetical protein
LFWMIQKDMGAQTWALQSLLELWRQSSYVQGS